MNYKKMLVAVMMGICLTAVSFAQDLNKNITNAVARQVAKNQFVDFTPEKRAEFEKLLTKAETVIKKLKKEYGYPDMELEQLSRALTDYTIKTMQYSRETEENHNITLTSDEFRAALYAVEVALHSRYDKESIYNANYNNLKPVQNWADYRKHCNEALDIVFNGVKHIANEEDNFQYTVLMTLTH